MIKKILIATLISALAVGAVGCASASLPSQSTSPPSTAQTQAADLTGEVTAVTTGKVTVKLVKMPAGGPNGAPGGAPGSAASQPPSTQTPPAAPAQGQPRTQAQQPALEYTGETRSLSIPSGLKITMMSRNPGGQTPGETAVSELKTGDLIQVWFSDSARTVISRISVMRRTGS